MINMIRRLFIPKQVILSEFVDNTKEGTNFTKIVEDSDIWNILDNSSKLRTIVYLKTNKKNNPSQYIGELFDVSYWKTLRLDREDFPRGYDVKVTVVLKDK